MGIKCKDIVDYLDFLASPKLAEDWDNVGLLVGNSNSYIKRIMICLDVCRKVVDEAIEKKVDLIISHHPVIFKGIKRINEDNLKDEVIYKLIKNNINVFCAHTNLDVADEGVNYCLAERLGLIKLKKLKEYKDEYGLGMVGVLESPYILDNFIKMLKDRLKLEKIRLISNIEREIKSVAIFCGSFDGDFNSVINSGADILVTGDIKYHTALEMSEMGLCAIDIGHFSSEIVMIPKLVSMLKDKFKDIDIINSNQEKDPIVII